MLDGVLEIERATERLRSAYAYWRTKSIDGRLPGRADIDPGEMVAFLANIVLLDVLREPLDFRYRLMGTAVEAHMLRPYIGELMSTVEHQRAPSRIWSDFETVALRRRPILTDVPYVGPHRDFMRVQHVIMPLAADGETVDMVLSVVDFVPKD
ncbi:MAG: PAS domain-containing protein [Alphaproteobacteria bacterium]|nr:PAS domain-containing protein [Alphaproteobacteria bacterium]